MTGSSVWILLIVLINIVINVSSDSDIIELTQDNFEHETQASTGMTTGDWIVEFYAPWCGHCKRLAPTWEKLATQLKGKINVAKVDATVHKILAKRFDVRGFPTIILLKKGNMIKYNGQRTVEALSSFALNPDTSSISDIPGEASIFEKIIEHFMTVSETIIDIFINKTMSGIVILLTGVMVGFLIGLIIGTPSHNISQQEINQFRKFVRLQHQKQLEKQKQNTSQNETTQNETTQSETTQNGLNNETTKDPTAKKNE